MFYSDIFSGKSESKPVEKISDETKSGDSPITISAGSGTLANCDKIAIEKKVNIKEDQSIEKTDENVMVKVRESENVGKVQENEMTKPVGSSFDNKVKKYTVKLTDSEDIKIFKSDDYKEDKDPLIISQRKNNTKYRPRNPATVILTNPPTHHEKFEQCEEKINNVIFQEYYKTINKSGQLDKNTVKIITEKNEYSKKFENDKDESCGKHSKRRDSTFKEYLILIYNIFFDYSFIRLGYISL